METRGLWDERDTRLGERRRQNEFFISFFSWIYVKYKHYN